MAPKPQMTAFNVDTELTDYIPIPRSLLAKDLPSTAKLLYGVLLDRGTLSRKNHYCNALEWVYVIYSIENLAQTLNAGPTIIKRYLKLLEERGYLRRSREGGDRVSHIYLYLPPDSVKDTAGGTFCTPESHKKTCHTATNVSTNNKKEQHKKNNYYQPCEEESL